MGGVLALLVTLRGVECFSSYKYMSVIEGLSYSQSQEISIGLANMAMLGKLKIDTQITVNS